MLRLTWTLRGSWANMNLPMQPAAETAVDAIIVLILVCR